MVSLFTFFPNEYLADSGPRRGGRAYEVVNQEEAADRVAEIEAALL